jgi:hypothetical protein
MMLPPSPPVFAPTMAPGTAASQPRFVSDWSSVFSSSCPNTTYIDLVGTKSFSLTPLHETDEVEERANLDIAKLSQSPTIFSLLQRSLPTHAGVPFRGDKPFVPSSRGVSAPAAALSEMKREPTPTTESEDMMFPMSMDGETDAVLADATQSCLSFEYS